MSKKISLLTLQTFCATGGIQKMSRTLAHSLQDICQRNQWDFRLLSLYDAPEDLQTQYIPASSFTGFSKNKLAFIRRVVTQSYNQDTVILSHINFALVGLIIKLFNPGCQLWLIAHGIEVWRPLSGPKKLLLRYCDKIIAVSHFTKNQMILLHRIDGDKCYILNNALDPFMSPPADFRKPEKLLSRYGLSPDDKILFTLTRLASSEKYKGYDNVIIAVAALKGQFPRLRYILSGKYDQAEESRVKSLISEYGVQDQVLLTGFIHESELAEHFLLADLFVLPSKKEGFGIVFIEALVCGLPVICGDADGSVDAIRNGELGTAINPDNKENLETAIRDQLKHRLNDDQRLILQQKCLNHFNEHSYIRQIENLLAS